MHELERLDLSCNEIEDLSGLCGLNSLRELDLHDNKISNVNCLETLRGLRVLDLSGNYIRDLDSMEGLRRTGAIRSLCLLGNPICRSPLVYPQGIFAALPSLQLLDNRTLEEHLADDDKRSEDSEMPTARIVPLSPPAPAVPSFSSPPSTHGSEAYLRHKVSQLEAEVAAYQDMFQKQESVLAYTESTRYPTSLPVEDRDQFLRDRSSFPFSSLLSEWRERAHRSTIRLLLAERRAEQLEQQLRRMEEEHKQQRQAANLNASNLQARLRAADSLVSEQQKRVEGLVAELEKEQEGRERAEEEVRRHERGLKGIRGFLNDYRSKMDKEMVAASVLELKMNKRLHSMEGRLEGAAKRIDMLGSLLEQKEVQLRNSQAALAAERRLFWLKQETAACRRGGEAEEEYGTDEGFLSDVRITPETESLLRAVFRQLDPQDSGSVPRGLLLQCLRSVADSGLFKCPPGSVRTVCADGACESVWEILVDRLQEQNQCDEDREDKDSLTWGEFLLLLVPKVEGHPDLGERSSLGIHTPAGGESGRGKDDLCICCCEACQQCVWKISSDGEEGGFVLQPSPIRGKESATKEDVASRRPNYKGAVCGRSPLSHQDYLSLHRARLVADCQWAMVPLQLPPIEEISSASERVEGRAALQPTSWLVNYAGGSRTCCGDSCDVARLKREAIRLARERAFLLRRLQGMGRALERRAESIRGFFETDIRRAELKLSRARSELSECQAQLREQEDRASVLERMLKTDRASAEERITRLEQDNSELRESVNALSERKDSDLMKQIDDSNTRASRLESELRILRKELSKNEVTNKTLQRDLIRHQTTASTSQDTILELRDKIVELEGRLSAVGHEKASLISKLTEAELNVDRLTENLRAMEMNEKVGCEECGTQTDPRREEQEWMPNPPVNMTQHLKQDSTESSLPQSNTAMRHTGLGHQVAPQHDLAHHTSSRIASSGALPSTPSSRIASSVAAPSTAAYMDSVAKKLRMMAAQLNEQG